MAALQASVLQGNSRSYSTSILTKMHPFARRHGDDEHLGATGAKIQKPTSPSVSENWNWAACPGISVFQDRRRLAKRQKTELEIRERLVQGHLEQPGLLVSGSREISPRTVPDRGKSTGAGIETELWFNPSIQDDFADWEKDADVIIGLYQKYGDPHIQN